MIPDIGLWEFLLFTVVALIVINPDDWPKVLRKVGYYYGQVHDFMLEARQYTRRTYEDIVTHEDDHPEGLGHDIPVGTDEDADASSNETVVDVVDSEEELPGNEAVEGEKA